jgi:DNA invertase Pin-like site-specific DNA recombinase
VRLEEHSTNDKGAKIVRAAQYVRMSTDHQIYSTKNQVDAIAAYAERHNITIVRTYADEGRSGLTLDQRQALRDLISDVLAGRADFDRILVYDVSRWGRFQDADESAHYEFICKEAGVRIEYCAEEFQNDGSLISTVVKNLKRAMAGEYSRELSTKVFAGQCRITELGFWHGGRASYGLRRQLIDENGVPKTRLEYGQKKYLQTDRVVLRIGPAVEVRTVRRIFKLFVAKRKCVTEITAELNAHKTFTLLGNRWSGPTIDRILTNEKYVGNIVFNRRSFKLKQRVVDNPPEMWVRRNNALEPIIAAEVFAKAQEIIENRRYRLTDQEVLDRLSALWKRKGHLSSNIIIAARNVPDASTYIKRFGSLTAAYKLIGFQAKPRYRWLETVAKMRVLIDEAIKEIVSKCENSGHRATFDAKARLLRLGDDFVICVGSARCVSEGDLLRWHVRVDRQSKSTLTLIARMDTSNEKIQEYCLLPTIELARTAAKRLRMTSRVFSKSSRHETLDALSQALANCFAATTATIDLSRPPVH